MSVLDLLTDSCEVLTQGIASVDAYNVPQFGQTDSTTYHCRLEQRGTPVEIVVGRDTLHSDWLLYLPPDAVVTGYDKVSHAVGLFEVAGQPYPVWGSTAPDHLEVSLRLVTG